MKKFLSKAALLLGVAMVAGFGAKAEAVEGWYGRADLGYSFDSEEFFETDGGAVTLEFDDGWSQHLGAGYAFANGFRLEGELGHRYNELVPMVDNLDEGSTHAWTAMINAFYDFNRGGAIEPYVGVGVGGARLSLDLYNSANPEYIDNSDMGLAYQALAGVAVALSPTLDLDIGYRWFKAPDFGFDGEDNNTPTLFHSDYEHQLFTVGLRLQLER